MIVGLFPENGSAQFTFRRGSLVTGHGLLEQDLPSSVADSHNYIVEIHEQPEHNTIYFLVYLQMP